MHGIRRNLKGKVLWSINTWHDLHYIRKTKHTVWRVLKSFLFITIQFGRKRRVSCSRSLSFLGLSLLRNHTEMLASQATEAQTTYNKRNNTTNQWSPRENSIIWLLCFFCDDGTDRKTQQASFVKFIRLQESNSRWLVSSDVLLKIRNLDLSPQKNDTFSGHIYW